MMCLFELAFSLCMLEQWHSPVQIDRNHLTYSSRKQECHRSANMRAIEEQLTAVGYGLVVRAGTVEMMKDCCIWTLTGG